jgi:hypothetical protein
VCPLALRFSLGFVLLGKFLPLALLLGCFALCVCPRLSLRRFAALLFLGQSLGDDAVKVSLLQLHLLALYI